jgi:hypothetical protein
VAGTKVLLAVLAFCLAAPWTLAQTPVVLAPVPKLQFFDSSGRTLAFGCVFAYDSGTTTPLDTFTDSTGTVLNTNPVVLDAGGFAGSGSSGIWLQAGQAYRLTVKAAGGSNCASGATSYSVDGIGAGTSLLTSNIAYSASPSFPIQAQQQMFTITLTGDAVAQPLTAVGLLPPVFVVFQITQDGSGGHSFTWPSNLIGGAAIGSNANQVTTAIFVWNGVNATALGPGITGDTSGPAESVGSILAAQGITATGGFTGPTLTATCTHPAVVGTLRLCSSSSVNFRNNGNTADQGISADSSDRGVWSFAGGLETSGTVPDLFIGGTSASFPRLKRNATALNLRLGDDSADAPLTVSTLGVSGPITSTSATYLAGGPEVAAPASPSAGNQKSYFKAASGLCAKDSAGVEYCGVHGNPGFIQAVKKTSSTCTTDTASYHACSDSLTWPVTFGDTNYTFSCTGKNTIAMSADNQQAATLNVLSYSATTITVYTQTQRSTPGANYDEIDCIGVHN